MSCSIWHFYPVWIGPSSSSNDWKLQNVGESTLPLRCVHVRVFYRLLVLHKKLGMLLWKIVNDWVFRGSSGHLPNGLHHLPREKSASFFVSRKLFSGLLGKVYLNWSRMRNKQLTALNTASSSLSSSNLSCRSWREMKVWMGNPHVGCQLKFHYFVG